MEYDEIITLPPCIRDNPNDFLTQEEKDELSIKLPSIKLNKLSNEEFKLRIGISKKIGDWMCSALHPSIIKLYYKYPLWGFYMDKNNEMDIKRIIDYSYFKKPKKLGETSRKSKKVLRGITFDCIQSEIKKDVLLKNLTLITKWTKNQLCLINMSDNPGIFIDPLGFMLFL